MKTVVLKRSASEQWGTAGELATEGFTCKTLELPYKRNIKGVSCIPVGEYECLVHISPKFGKCYEVVSVPNRGNILIHAGNFAGDLKLGYKTDSHGCILLGESFAVLEHQNAITNSKKTIDAFHAFMDFQPFKLVIQ